MTSDELSKHHPMVVVVVVAVDDRRSLDHAGSELAVLRREGKLANKMGMLVANKADLVRTRVVTEEEGRTLAGRYDVSYIETSTAINYNVDELLVIIVKKMQEKLTKFRKISVTDRIKDFVGRKISGDIY